MDVVVANAGDSRRDRLVYIDGRDAAGRLAAKDDDAPSAVDRTPRTKWLTRCHSPDDDEAKRLTDAGARLGRMRREGNEVRPDAVYPGGYAVSRAIGDFDAPRARARRRRARVEGGAEGCVLVVASDGRANVVSEDACGDIVRESAPCVKPAAERIMEAALGTERGLHDDATVVVVRAADGGAARREVATSGGGGRGVRNRGGVRPGRGARQGSSMSTTTTASTSEPVPRKSWTRRLSVGGRGTKSQIEKLRAEMEDDITVRRRRACRSTRWARTGARTGRTPRWTG